MAQTSKKKFQFLKRILIKIYSQNLIKTSQVFLMNFSAQLKLDSMLAYNLYKIDRLYYEQKQLDYKKDSFNVFF